MKTTRKRSRFLPKPLFLMGTTALALVLGLMLTGCPKTTETPTLSPSDTTEPELSAGSVSGLATLAGTTATLKFTSDEAGTYYYVVLASGDSAPDEATVKAQGVAVAKGTAVATASENTISVTGLTTSTTYKAYIVVEDASGNTSTVLTIDGVNPVLDPSAVIAAAIAGKTGSGTPADPYVVQVSGVELYDSVNAIDNLETILEGLASGIPTGDISLDLSACTGTSFYAPSGVTSAVFDRFVSVTLPDTITVIASATMFGYTPFSEFSNLKSIIGNEVDRKSVV
jgi:hypothetical protein